MRRALKKLAGQMGEVVNPRTVTDMVRRDDAELEDCRWFTKADLRHADLRGAALTDADFTDALIDGAKLKMSELNRAKGFPHD